MTTLSVVEPTSGKLGIDAEKFRTATRHSARVRFLRVAIPAGIVLVLGMVVIVTFFNPLRMLVRLPIDPGKIVLSGTRITMQAPRLAGFTRDSRPYEVTARAASQDLTRPDVLDLKDIKAKMEMQDKGQVVVTAAKGLYETKADRLTLNQDIVLTTSSGYEVRLRAAEINIKTGSIVSQSPVEVKLPDGTLSANSLQVDENGDVLRFEGNVVMNLILDESSTNGPKRP